MAALRNTPGGTAEGRDRLWRLLNVALVVGSVAATVLAVGVVIALFLWLYTLPPVESERAAPRNPMPRQAAPPPPPAPQAPEPGAAPAPPPPPAAPAPAAVVPNASTPAEPAPPEAAESAPTTNGRRSRRAGRSVARPPGDPGAPVQ